MEFHVAIVEDEVDDVKRLTGFLQRFEQEEGYTIQITVFSDGLAILDNYHSQYDLIVLDIEMPHMDGMATAKAIRQRDEEVLLIFITNLANYAIKGYEVNALDYILKPITYPAFLMKAYKAIGILKRRPQKFVLIPNEKGAFRVNVSDIIYIEVTDHLLTYHTRKNVYRSLGSLTEIEARFTEIFVRINRSCLVNLNYVEGYTENEVTVAEENLTISRTRKKEFMEKLAAFYC